MAVNLVKAKSWFQRFAVAFTLTGSPALVLHKPVAASQTIRVGDPVTISGGELSTGLATDNLMYGVAMGNVVTTAGNELTDCPVAVADRNTVFVGQADAASNGINDGAECDIIASGTSWLVDIGASLKGVCLIVGHVPGDIVADATTAGRLHFIWKRSQWDLLVATTGG